MRTCVCRGDGAPPPDLKTRADAQPAFLAPKASSDSSLLTCLGCSPEIQNALTSSHLQSHAQSWAPEPTLSHRMCFTGDNHLQILVSNPFPMPLPPEHLFQQGGVKTFPSGWSLGVFSKEKAGIPERCLQAAEGQTWACRIRTASDSYKLT